MSGPSSNTGSTDPTTEPITGTTTNKTTDPTTDPTDPSNTGTTSTSQVPDLDPSISLKLTGNALFLTDTTGQLQLKLEKAADSIEQGPALLSIRIEDRYLQEIVAGDIPGAVQTLSRDSATETTLISYKLDKLSPGTVLTTAIDFHVANAEIPQDYRFAVQLSLEAIITNTTKTTETSTVPLRTMEKASTPLSLSASDTQSAALTEPQSFSFALMNLTNLMATSELSLSDNYILPKGQEAEIVVSQTGPGEGAAILGPVTLEVVFSDVSAIESITVPQGVTMSPETLASPTTISLALPYGVGSNELITIPIRLKSLADVAEASTIPVTASLKFDPDNTLLSSTTATYTLYSQEMSLTGPGTFRIGADVQAITNMVRPSNTISIPGPLTLTYTFADNSLLDLNSLSGMNYDGIAPVIETDTTTNSTTITYQLNNGVPAGADISLPIYFSSKSGIPENSTIALSSELKAGATVLASQNGTYTFKSLDPSVEMSFRPYPNETKWDYLIAQPAPFYIDYNKVGGSGTITDGRIRFMLEDNTYVNKLNASDLSSADAKEYIYDTNNKIIGVDYYYRSLIAGQTLAIPLEVVTRTFYTPDNYELKFNVTVVEPDGQGGFTQVTEPVSGSFTYHAIRPTLRKYHAINRYVDYTTTNRSFGGFDQNNDGLIDADGAALQRFDFKLIQGYSTQNTYGVRVYNPITITDTLPEGAVFDPEVNPGWSYVEGSTTQVTYTKTTDTIAAVSLSGHGKGLYLVDSQGQPAYPGIVSTDSRAWEIVKDWIDDGTQEKIFPITYQKILASQPVSLLAWLKKNEPEVLNKTKYVFSVKD